MSIAVELTSKKFGSIPTEILILYHRGIAGRRPQISRREAAHRREGEVGLLDIFRLP